MLSEHALQAQLNKIRDARYCLSDLLQAHYDLTQECAMLSQRVERLESEADWLADGIECVRPGPDCPMLKDDGEHIDVCIKCWRDQARKAVSNG